MPAKKPAPKKLKQSPAKKSIAKTAPKPSAKPATAKKTAPKKKPSTGKKTAPKKPAAKKPAAKKTAPKKAPASPTKTKPTGLGGFAPGKLARNNSLDTGLAGVNAAVASNAEIHNGMSASLVLVEPAKNMDRYYILQLLSHKKQSSHFYVFKRWGRTGTGGQAQLEGPISEVEATTLFEKIFKEKSGLVWASRSDPSKAGKYAYMEPSDTSGPAGKWQYYLTNDTNGKADGWYDYDADNSKEVEDVYRTYLSNKSMCTRFVHSETSGFTYEVDLSSLTQTNTSSRKSRPIRRQT